MKIKQLIAFIIVAPCSSLLTLRPVYGFNIIYTQPPTSLSYSNLAYYETNVGNQGILTRDNLVKLAPPNTESEFWRVLTSSFSSGWDFRSNGTPVYGDFLIDQYKVCPPFSVCSDLSTSGSVGGFLDLVYKENITLAPTTRQPNPFDGNVRWIQWVRSNHSLATDRHGDKESVIDSDPGTPFYDIEKSKTPYGFSDQPSRKDIGWDHDWIADLYLAEEIKKPDSNVSTVLIYGGVRWGWHNRVDRKKKEPNPVPGACPVNSSIGICDFSSFSDNLSSGYEEDAFHLKELTPGKKFYAYIDNDIPENRCNPNTLLGTYDENGAWYYDNDSSQLGDGFASALTGIVSSDGTIYLNVRPANGGRRGEDRGNYELNVAVFNNEADFPYVVGSSGGGGVVVGSSGGGGVQHDPILPNRTEQGWQVFRNVPGCRWYDPHTPYGFEFQALDDTLFTEILDFPVGPDNQFTVSVGDRILGEFGAGDSIDFTSLFGSGISNFKITGIDSLLGSTEQTAFPIQLAFNDRIGSFKMRPFSQENSPQPVSESTSALGLLALGAWGIIKAMKIRLEK